MLEVRESGSPNGVPSKNYFRELFRFSEAELLHYIESRAGPAEELYEKSLDQRVRSSFLSNRLPIEDAAVDFVLAMWGRRASTSELPVDTA
jgi:hypothetical protein